MHSQRFFFFLLLFYYYFFFQKNLASFFSRDTEEEIRACESRLIIALAVTQRIILGSQSIFYKPCFLFLNTVYMHIARPRDILTHGAAEVTSFFYLCGSPRPNCWLCACCCAFPVTLHRPPWCCGAIPICIEFWCNPFWLGDIPAINETKLIYIHTYIHA